MKKLFLIPFVALAMAGCSNDVATPEGGTAGSGEIKTNYVTVNIVPTNSATRAATEIGDGIYTDGNGTYEDGKDAESKVTEALFYFFNGDGDAAIVDYGTNASYRLFTVTAGDDHNDGFGDEGKNHDETIEMIREATLILQSKQKENLPTQVLVVLNPNYDYVAEGNLSLEDVKKKLNGAVTKLTNKDKGFVMSSAVYAADGTTVMDAVSLEGHIEKTEEAALKNPVNIYVERVVAKLTLKLDLTAVDAEKGLYDTGETYGYGSTMDENGIVGGDPDHYGKIYVKLLGWNVTTTPDKSYLVKRINSGWFEEDLFQTATEPWNVAAYHRSFWAINPDGVEYLYGTFNTKGETGTDGLDKTLPNANVALSKELGDNVIYMPENAAKSATDAFVEKPSNVIFAAQLVDEDGNALELAEFMGQVFVDKEANGYKGIKTAIVSALKTAYYTKKEVEKEDGTKETAFVKLSPEDIEVLTATQAGNNDEGRYPVKGKLIEGKTWYKGELNADGTWKSEPENVEASVINEELSAIESAKIWKDGYTYYYFDIRHLSGTENAPGYYGVVRNHVYQATVTALTGLGTPVYDPEEIIIPEHPKDNKGFVAAKINILSWRVVNQEHELLW